MDLEDLAMCTCPNSERVDGRHTIECLTTVDEVLCFSRLLGSGGMALGSLKSVT